MMKTALPPKFLIRIYSQEHSKLVQEKLFELGYKWFLGVGGYVDAAFDEYAEKEPVIAVEDGELAYGYLAWFQKQKRYDSFSLIATDDLFSTKKRKQDIEIPLDSKQYTATISEENVVVRCQTISFETIEKIWNAVQEMKKD